MTKEQEALLNKARETLRKEITTLTPPLPKLKLKR